MKIIFANNYYYVRGGAERVALDEMRMCSDAGHDVIPFTRQYDKNHYSPYLSYFPPHFEYDHVPLVQKISAAFKLIYSRECGKNFGRLLDDTSPDLVHVHNIYGRLTTSILDAAARRDVPVVMTLHDLKLLCPSYLMLLNGKVCEKCAGKKFYHCTVTKCHRGELSSSVVYTVESYFNSILDKYNKVKYFICPSKFIRDKHVALGIPKEKLITVPNFIRENEIVPGSGDGSYALFVGRLSREKGILTLLKSIKGIDVPLKIVGDGPMKQEIESFVKENGLENVRLEGYKSGEELFKMYRDAQFVIYPSECFENAPMTILEAFAHGKPVIGSNIGGIPEMLLDGHTGLLFEAGDSDELRRQIIKLSECRPLIKTMGENAIKLVATNYSETVHYQNLITVYNLALSNQHTNKAN